MLTHMPLLDSLPLALPWLGSLGLLIACKPLTFFFCLSLSISQGQNNKPLSSLIEPCLRRRKEPHPPPHPPLPAPPLSTVWQEICQLTRHTVVALTCPLLAPRRHHKGAEKGMSSSQKGKQGRRRWVGRVYPGFGRSVNHISTKGGRLCPPPSLFAYPALCSFLRPWVNKGVSCFSYTIQGGHKLKYVTTFVELNFG